MGTWPVRQTCFRTRWMQIMSICKQEAAFNGWSFCILIQSSQSDGIRSIESSEYLSSTQTFVHRKTAVPDTFFCSRSMGCGVINGGDPAPGMCDDGRLPRQHLPVHGWYAKRTLKILVFLVCGRLRGGHFRPVLDQLKMKI